MTRASAGRPAESPDDTARRTRLRAILLVVVAVSLFSVLDVCAKLIAMRGVPVLEIVWVRYAVHFAFAAILLNPLSSPASWRVGRPVIQVVRALMLIGTTALNFVAIKHLQLAQTVTISFLGPLVICLLSFLFLKERIGPRRIAAVLVGFLGVLIVMQPGLDGFQAAMLLSLGSMLCYSIYAVLTRVLAGTESPGSMILILAGVPTLVLLPFMPAIWQTPDDPVTLLLMLGTGITGGGGHALVILAHRHAPASVLAPFTYAQIVTMVAGGYLVFGDVPTLSTIVGAAVVIASGLYLLHRERVRRGDATPVAPS